MNDAGKRSPQAYRFELAALSGQLECRKRATKPEFSSGSRVSKGYTGGTVHMISSSSAGPSRWKSIKNPRNVRRGTLRTSCRASADVGAPDRMHSHVPPCPFICLPLPSLRGI